MLSYSRSFKILCYSGFKNKTLTITLLAFVQKSNSYQNIPANVKVVTHLFINSDSEYFHISFCLFESKFVHLF